MRGLAILSILFFCVSCNKNLDSKWDIDVLIPLAYAQLDVNDLIADSLVSVGSDNSLTLVYTNDELKLNFDTLADLPETSSFDFFVIPFTSIDFNAGASFPTPLEELDLDIDRVELQEMRVKKGKIGVLIRNYIEDSLESSFQIVSSSLDGQPLSISETIPSANGNIPGEFYNEYDVSGYTLDLTGENGNDFNTIVSNLDVIINPSGNGVTITNQDSLVIITSYIDFEAAYVRGNFGQEIINIENETSQIDFFQDLNPEFIDLNNPKIKIDLINGIGAEFRMTLEEMISLNSSTNTSIPLDHQLIGSTINVNRAIDNGYPIPYTQEFLIDQTNSNIEEWLENIPQEITYSISAELNPLGNISGGNDFIYCESELGFDFQLEIPLCIAASNFNLSDTIDISLDEEDNIENVQFGQLKAYIDNTFPFEGELQLYLVENNSITDSIFFQNGINGSLQLGNPSQNVAQSVLIAEVSQEKFENLKNANALHIRAILNTANSDEVKFYNDQRIDLNLVLEANYLVNTE